MVAHVVKYITTDIWRFRINTLSKRKGFLIRTARIIILAVRGYMEDNCRFRASALTFFTLLSIVPVLAMMFAIAKGFGLEERVESQVMKMFEGQEDAAEMIVTYANEMLETVNGGWVAGVGIAFLFWAIIKVLSNVESSFNEIWGIKRGRHIGRKFSDYLSVMLVCPILLVMSSGIVIALSGHIEETMLKIPVIKDYWQYLSWSLQIFKYITVWVVFTFLLMFMPNTKVKWRSGLIAGIVTGTLFIIIQGLYIYFQVGVAKNNAIYGGFAALPMFLIWLQISWLIILFGAELAFAHQNVDTYEFEPDCLKASYSMQRLCSLTIAQMLVRNFCEGKPSVTADDISRKLEMPIRLVRDLLFKMVKAGVASEVTSGKKGRSVGYQPALDVDKMTVKFVIDKLETSGVESMPVQHTIEMEQLESCLVKMSEQLESCEGNIPLRSIVSDR